MRQYGKKKHKGFWCTCEFCVDNSNAARMQLKRRARRNGRREILEQTAPLSFWEEMAEIDDMYWW